MWTPHFPRWFSQHSETIAQWSFLTATLLIGTKNFVESYIETGHISRDLIFSLPGTMDLIATACFFISSIMYGAAKKDPNKVRIGGLFAMIAASCLIVGGWRGSFDDTSFWLHVAGMLPTVWAGFWLFQGKWLVAATPELVARIPYAIGGYMQGDIGQIFSCLFAAMGDLGLIATGLKLREQERSKNPVTEPSPT